ncbi:hypothetical protein IU405_08710 [Polaribacter sp. BAL334]|uniref:hypothetical protein n=1 Tax=Polaribacter sp. BAL334 TaxID=1708178 RepID=UPI0018D226CF|nr:hypothetical protein [Polaribacter sp. BAL334]MBG7612326.1 hypothetical protein [Polaribacter sp. BAL334]
MKIKINNKVIPLYDVSYNDGLNFGRINQIENQFTDFVLELSFEEFTKLIQEEYNSLKNEIKEDDDLYNDSSSFKEINYKELKEVLYSNSGLELIIKDYLDRIIYNTLFQYSGKKNYTINSTENIEIRNETIYILGKCFKNR